jgi:two-component system response regulator NreC
MATEPRDGELLVISINTAEAHRGHIMQKLNLHTRAELVKYAIKSAHRLLKLPDTPPG